MTDLTNVPELGEETVVMLQPIPFKVTGEVFYAVGSQPAGILLDLAKLNQTKDMGSQVNSVLRLLEGSLIPESFERFKARMYSTDRPITLQHLNAVIAFIMEAQTKYPTQPSSPSPVVSPTTGPSSTVGVPATV
jgi:hypothetical protein